MAESCTVDATLSRKIQSEILRGLASVGQKPVADAIAKSETWVSRFASDQLKSCADLLAAVGLKVVPAAYTCFDKEYVDRLRYFAEIGIKQAPEPLSFEDEA